MAKDSGMTSEQRLHAHAIITVRAGKVHLKPEDIEAVKGLDCSQCHTREVRILYWDGNSNLYYSMHPDDWPFEIVFADR